MLLEAVVVAEDGAGADVGPGADAPVADVGEVIGLRALLQARVLHLNEIADVRLGPDLGAGPQACERADARPGLDMRTLDVAVGKDLRAVPYRHAGAEEH